MPYYFPFKTIIKMSYPKKVIKERLVPINLIQYCLGFCAGARSKHFEGEAKMLADLFKDETKIFHTNQSEYIYFIRKSHLEKKLNTWFTQKKIQPEEKNIHKLVRFFKNVIRRKLNQDRLPVRSDIIN